MKTKKFALLLICLLFGNALLAQSTLTTAEKNLILEKHNEYRQAVNSPALVWSSDLEEYAQKWANYLVEKDCAMQHRPHSGEFAQVHGENIFMGWGGSYTPVDAVINWAAEKSSYSGENISETNYMNFGHYTQVIWCTTKEVGCAEAVCGEKFIIICNYSPTGNYIGENPKDCE